MARRTSACRCRMRTSSIRACRTITSRRSSSCIRALEVSDMVRRNPRAIARRWSTIWSGSTSTCSTRRRRDSSRRTVVEVVMSARRILVVLLVAFCFAIAWLGHPRAQPRTAAAVVAIRNATLVTVTRGTVQNGTIVLRDGKIAALGTNVPVPAGADVVDASGKFVSPGIIDCHSHIAADSFNEMGTTVSSMTGIEDVFNPSDVDIYLDLAGGLTTANVLHGSANPIGGKNY